MTKYKTLGMSLFLAFFLTACGQDEALNAYQEDMNTFFERAAEYKNSGAFGLSGCLCGGH